MDEAILTTYLRICNATDYIITTFSTYIDLNYLHWLLWVFYPLVITFLLPLVIFLFLYASALFCHLYRLRRLLKDAYSRGDTWAWARKFLAALWDAQGNIWHGHEVVGLEKIPSQGPALLIYYHGALPVDLYYLVAKTMLIKDRQIRAVGDRFLFQIPGMRLFLRVFNVNPVAVSDKSQLNLESVPSMRLFLRVFNVIPGTVSACTKLMADGHLLAIAPGGVREAYFSESYSLLWRHRVGFAKIATETKVPIIPVFTKNCREAFRSLSWGRGFFRWVYEKTRLPIVPIYGMFPVKLITYIGDPVPYSDDDSAEDIAEKVKDSLQRLIRKHQQVPGSVVRALFERFHCAERFKDD